MKHLWMGSLISSWAHINIDLKRTSPLRQRERPSQVYIGYVLPRWNMLESWLTNHLRCNMVVIKLDLCFSHLFAAWPHHPQCDHLEVTLSYFSLCLPSVQTGPTDFSLDLRAASSIQYWWIASASWRHPMHCWQ